jgi:hypothetical protein
MVEIFQGFPPTLPAADGYARLHAVLGSRGFVLNPKQSRHRMWVAEARKAAGVLVERGGGKTVWTRNGAVHGAVVSE